MKKIVVTIENDDLYSYLTSRVLEERLKADFPQIICSCKTERKKKNENDKNISGR